MIIVERKNGNVIYLNNVNGELDKGTNTFIFYDGERHVIPEVKKVTVLEGNLIHETLCDIQTAYNEMKITDLALDIPTSGVRFVNCCKSNDIETVGDLLKLSTMEFLRFRNVGVKCIADVRRELKRKYNIEWS